MCNSPALSRIKGVSFTSLLTRRPVTARCSRNLEPPWEIPKVRTGNMQSLTRSLFLINTSAPFIGASNHQSKTDFGRNPTFSCYDSGEARTCVQAQKNGPGTPGSLENFEKFSGCGAGSSCVLCGQPWCYTDGHRHFYGSLRAGGMVGKLLISICLAIWFAGPARGEEKLKNLATTLPLPTGECDFS